MSDNIIPPEDLNIEKIFQYAFRTMVDQIVACIVNTILVVVSCVFLAITIIGILAIPAVIGEYVESMIRMARGEKVGIGDYFKIGFNRFGTLLGATILSFLGIIIGFIWPLTGKIRSRLNPLPEQYYFPVLSRVFIYNLKEVNPACDRTAILVHSIPMEYMVTIIQRSIIPFPYIFTLNTIDQYSVFPWFDYS